MPMEDGSLITESMDCPYKDICTDLFKEPGMDEHRKTCDCINCAMCDYYWLIYDRRSLEKLRK